MEDTDSDSEGDFFSHSYKKKSRQIIDESDDDSSSSDEEEEDDEGDDDEDNNVCPICLGDFANQLIGIPENCKHMFCVECIQEWTKNVNNCPVDRKKINFISVHANKNGPEIEKLPIQDVKKVEDVYEDPPTYCLVCGRCDQEESLLLCDECDNGYHMDCLNPPLTSVPIDEWFCDECQPSNAPSTSRGSTSHGAGTSSGWRRSESQQRFTGYEDNDYIGDPEVLERLMDETIASGRHAIAISRMFGQLSDRRARTAASTRGRPRMGSRNDRSNSRSSSSRPKKKSKKKKRKTSKTKKKNQSVEKAKRKVIERELKRFREKHQAAATEAAGSSKDAKDGGESSGRLAVFGNQFNLDEFYGDPDEDYEDADEREKEHRSTICNTTDVVGSILGGFGTLDPDNVLVLKDGTIKVSSEDSSKQLDNDNKTSSFENNSGKRRRMSSSSSIKEIITKNKKRRKINFVEGDSDEDTLAARGVNNGVSSDTSLCIEYKDNNDDRQVSQYVSKEHKKKLKLAKEKLRQGFLEKQKEKHKAEELKKQVQQLLQEGKDAQAQKTQSSLFTTSKFKIPKRTTAKSSDEGASSESNDNKSKSDSSEENTRKCNTEKSFRDFPSKKLLTTHCKDHTFDDKHSKRYSLGPKKGDVKPKLQVKTIEAMETTKLDVSCRKTNFPVARKEDFSLEKKIELYSIGKLKRKMSEKKNNTMPQSCLGNQTRKLSKPSSSTCKSTVSNPTSVHSILKVKPVSSCTETAKSSTIKKHISLQDYKNRQLFTDLFGEQESDDKHSTDTNTGQQSADQKVVKFKGDDVNNDSQASHSNSESTNEILDTTPLVSTDTTKSSNPLHPSSYASSHRQARDELCESIFSPQSESCSESSDNANNSFGSDYTTKQREFISSTRTTNSQYDRDIPQTCSKSLTTDSSSSLGSDYTKKQKEFVKSTSTSTNNDLLIHTSRHSTVSHNEQSSLSSSAIGRNTSRGDNHKKPHEEPTTTTAAKTTTKKHQSILKVKSDTKKRRDTRTPHIEGVPSFEKQLSKQTYSTVSSSLSSSTSNGILGHHHTKFPPASSLPYSENPLGKFLSASKKTNNNNSPATSSTTSSIPVGVVSPQIRKSAPSDCGDRTSVNNVAAHKGEPAILAGTSAVQVEKKVLSRQEYIDAVKEFLKPYYKRGKLNKDQWKEVVKKAVKKIEQNPSIFSYNLIGRLVKSLLVEPISST